MRISEVTVLGVFTLLIMAGGCATLVDEHLKM
jgi:hypothetical protein